MARAPGLAVITGASGGIGLELARLMAARGHALVLAARSGDRLRTIAAQLGGAHQVRVEVVEVDLAVPDGAPRLARTLEERALQPEILVNNAGVGAAGRFDAMEPERLLGLLQLNVTSLVHLTRLVVPGLVARGGGYVLNVASTAAFVPGPFMAAYYASKAFVLSLSHALREELRSSGVSVTALCPGPVHTGFQQEAGLGDAPLFKGPFVMEADAVAAAGYRGMMARKAVVVPGLPNRVLASTSGLIPGSAAARVAARLNGRSR